MIQFEYNQLDQGIFIAKFICFIDLEGNQKSIDDNANVGLSFGHLSNLRQIETRKRLFETKLKIMDNEVIKFTCNRAQIPSYFTKIDRLTEVERAAKELKNVPADGSYNENSIVTDR